MTNSSYRKIKQCRICGNPELTEFLNLGDQALTGVFPRKIDEPISAGPLELVKCVESRKRFSCGLVQLRHSYNLNEMYGMNYGYRSGLNISMKKHLKAIVERAVSFVSFSSGDIALDIGSNDGTLLSLYPQADVMLVGIDPTAEKFRRFYPENSNIVPDFFSAKVFRNHFGSSKAKIITAIAMFYDLESPIDFVSEIGEVLSDDGICIFEQSYMPEMIRKTAYDTVCHEHLEYYGLRQIKWLFDRADLKIIDVFTNGVNGGSFCITAAHKGSDYPEASNVIGALLDHEMNLELDTMRPYEKFRERVEQHRESLIQFVRKTNSQDKLILGYGASTKGNVILQYCGFTKNDIRCIAEVNEDKFGRLTPGTFIPIVSEPDARNMRPDFFLVLPWHFEQSILERERKYLASGGRLVFPLPEIKIV